MRSGLIRYCTFEEWANQVLYVCVEGVRIYKGELKRTDEDVWGHIVLLILIQQ